MARIYKYGLEAKLLQTVELPIGSQILSIQMQFGRPTIWAMHEQNENKATVEVRLVATGEEFDIENWRYIETVQDGEFVWHIFMRE